MVLKPITPWYDKPRAEVSRGAADPGRSVCSMSLSFACPYGKHPRGGQNPAGRPRGDDLRLSALGVIGLVVAVVAGPTAAQDARRSSATVSLPEARRGFKTVVVRRGSDRQPVPQAPPRVFRTIRYESPVGQLAAYLTPDPRDGKKHPAIIWITGGDSNTIDDGLWKEADPRDDQTAAAYRKAGIVMMFPSLRGGNDNPGVKEGFFGEVDDILAAADHLAKEPYVDASRLYRGGHSTGATLVMLVAASTDRFRGVFSFGPAHNVRGYGPEFLPFDTSNPKEIALRAPALWLHSVRCPTFVFEGTREPANVDSLRAMQKASKNPLIHFHVVKGATHFSILAPTNRLIARKMLQDNGPAPRLSFTDGEVNRPFTQ
jgi:dipeptidyl aminopeptidase/acylaminoacyl peptidase